jgi:hypothetical protein
MGYGVVNIARCPQHGLHGERTECHVCGGLVEQVPMIPGAEHAEAVRALWLAGGALYGALNDALNDPNAEPPDIDRALQEWRDAVYAYVHPLESSPAGGTAAALPSERSDEGQSGADAPPAGEGNVVELRRHRPEGESA